MKDLLCILFAVDKYKYLSIANPNYKFAYRMKKLVHQKICSHPSVARLIGSCDEGGCGALVYDLKSLDSVHDFITNGLLISSPAINHLCYFSCSLFLSRVHITTLLEGVSYSSSPFIF